MLFHQGAPKSTPPLRVLTNNASTVDFGTINTLSGISPAKRSRSEPNSVYVDKSRGDNVQGILGAMGPFWPK